MEIGKWIGGFLGFITNGPLGLIAGFAIGSLYDAFIKTSNNAEVTTSEHLQEEGQRNSFLFSLLVLSAYIIRADKKVMHSEMQLLRAFLRTNFGLTAQQQGESIILKIFEQQKQMSDYDWRTLIYQCCRQIVTNMSYSQRLLLLDFLSELSKADKVIVAEEITALKDVASHLQIHPSDIESILNLRKSDLPSAYKILGIPPTATNEEVKAAYRKMALRHHPDKVSALGEEAKKKAEEKFQEINRAKEMIYKERGM